MSTIFGVDGLSYTHIISVNVSSLAFSDSVCHFKIYFWPILQPHNNEAAVIAAVAAIAAVVQWNALNNFVFNFLFNNE